MTPPELLNPSLVREIVNTQFPHIRATQVRLIGVQGNDHDAYEIDGAWIVRFPKVPAQVERIEIESRIMNALVNRLPLAVPRFELQGQPSRHFPHRFSGYRKLAGVAWDEVEPWPVTSAAIAAQIGRFLMVLHGVALEEARRAGVRPDVELTLARRWELLDASRSRFQPRVPPDLQCHVEAFLARGVRASNYAGPLVLVHNDLLAEHVLLNPSQTNLTGVIDWGDVALGDPAIDFVGLLCWAGGEFVREVLRHYDRPHEAIIDRAAFIARCLALGDLADAGEAARYPLGRAIHHVRVAFAA